jgi:hypothetical protein
MVALGCAEASLAVQLKALKARAQVMVQSDVEDARYDYEQCQVRLSLLPSTPHLL